MVFFFHLVFIFVSFFQKKNLEEERRKMGEKEVINSINTYFSFEVEKNEKSEQKAISSYEKGNKLAEGL